MYDSKSDNQKKGLMGELLTHLLFEEVFSNFKVASIFLNKEERSMKKGFDLIFVNTEDSSPWYSEVKSGSCNLASVNDKSISLLEEAKSGIHSKFISESDYLWISVLTDLNATIDDISVRNELERLFQLDATNLPEKKSSDKRVIIVSVVYESLVEKIDIERIKSLKNAIEGSNLFSKIILFSIQKETYTKIESYLLEQINNIK